MSLDSARSVSLGATDGAGPTTPAATVSLAARLWALVDMAQLARRPRWLLVSLVTALALAGMPAVHVTVFGAERLADATVAQVEAQGGARLGGEVRAMVRRSVIERSLAVSVVLAAVGAVLALLLSGMTLHGGALLVGLNMSGAQALAITGVVSLATAVLRVFLWVLAFVAFGSAEAVQPDWMQVGAVTLAHFVESDAAVLMTFYGGLDAVRLAGVALAVLCVTTMHPGTSVIRATIAASGWMAVVLLLRLVLSAMLKFPIL